MYIRNNENIKKINDRKIKMTKYLAKIMTIKQVKKNKKIHEINEEYISIIIIETAIIICLIIDRIIR